MVVGVIKRIFGRGVEWGEPEPYDPGAAALAGFDDSILDEAISRLTFLRDELGRLKYKIVNEVDEYYRRMQDSAARGDRESVETFAAEIVMKQKVLKAVIAYIKLLDYVIAKLRSSKDVTELAKHFAGIEYVMGMVANYLAHESPEMAVMISNTISQAESVIRNSQILVESLPKPVITQDAEVRKLIAQAFAEAQREAEILTPQLPAYAQIDYEALEKQLIEHIQRNNGVLNVRRAAEELGVTPQTVKEVLYRLQKKGVITITGKTTGQGEALYA